MTCSTMTNARCWVALFGVRRWVRPRRGRCICGGGSDEYAVLDVLGFPGTQVAGHRRPTPGTPVTGCWKRSASSPKNNSPPAATDRAVRGPSRRLLRRSGRRPAGSCGTGPAVRVASMGRCRVRQPARRVPLGHRPKRSRYRDAIAAHTTMLALPLHRFEPVGWAEELLPAATAADLRQLPRLYTAASLCSYTVAPSDGGRYAENRGRVRERRPLRPVRAFETLRVEQQLRGQRPSLHRSASSATSRSFASLTAHPGLARALSWASVRDSSTFCRLSATERRSHSHRGADRGRGSRPRGNPELRSPTPSSGTAKPLVSEPIPRRGP